MRKLKPYDEDAFEFYKKVVGKKNTTDKYPTYKVRLSSLEENIEVLYKNYDELFESNTLQELVEHGYSGNEKDDLHKLYSYRSNIFQELKVKLTTTETKRIISTCQNCTIGEVSSFDHVVPKDEFAEFVVNPKNLFPSCSICNGHKSTAWRNGNKRLFLNLYTDHLPEQQYLFVEISASDGAVEARFYLDNRNGINEELYELINNHYTKLHLCRRFSENIDLVVSPLINEIESYISKLTISEIVEVAIDRSMRNKTAFGYNHWPSILEIALLNNTSFLSRFNVLK